MHSTISSLLSLQTSWLPALTTLFIVKALVLIVGFLLTLRIAYRKRRAPWSTNPWLFLPITVLFLSPTVLFYVPIVIMIPLYLTLAAGIFFLNRKSSALWYRNPLLLILLVLVIVVIFKGTLLTLLILAAVILGGLNFVIKKIFPK